jgi:hypothetical protein
MDDGEKRFQDTEIQVDAEELRDNGFEESAETTCFKMLKDHLIKLMGRMSPENQNYYDMVYEGVDLARLFQMNVDDVFFDDDAQEG